MRTILNPIKADAAILATLVALAALSGCGEEPGSDATVSVVASTTQVADLAANVAGERADVRAILEPTSDPHEYEPRPSDAEALAGADLVLGSGGEVDFWLAQLVEGSGSDAPVVELIDSVRAIPGAEGEELDPHWWQDPMNASLAIDAIRDQLADIDPGGREVYADNAAAYAAELRRLDSQVARCMSRVPASQRKLVTSHDALGPYAARYDVEIIGAAIPALTTQAQASAGETAELIELIRETDVRTIFPEAGVSAELETAIADGSGAAVGDELWADALGPAGSDGATYLEAMASNTVKLVDGFTGGAVACTIDVGR